MNRLKPETINVRNAGRAAAIVLSFAGAGELSTAAAATTPYEPSAALEQTARVPSMEDIFKDLGVVLPSSEHSAPTTSETTTQSPETALKTLEGRLATVWAQLEILAAKPKLKKDIKTNPLASLNGKGPFTEISLVQQVRGTNTYDKLIMYAPAGGSMPIVGELIGNSLTRDFHLHDSPYEQVGVDCLERVSFRRIAKPESLGFQAAQYDPSTKTTNSAEFNLNAKGAQGGINVDGFSKAFGGVLNGAQNMLDAEKSKLSPI